MGSSTAIRRVHSNVGRTQKQERIVGKLRGGGGTEKRQEDLEGIGKEP